jgi:hypothetical protein
MIAIVAPEPLVDEVRSYAVMIWDGEYPVGLVPVSCGEDTSDVVPFCCEEYPNGAAPFRAGWIWKSGVAVKSLTAVVCAFVVNAMPGEAIARTSIVKKSKALALFSSNLNN